MKFNGALVKTDARVIGVAVVDKSFVDKEPLERAKYIQAYIKGFGGQVPVVLLLGNADNLGDSEDFWGRPDLVAHLKEIPLNMMTFKTYTAPDVE
ncbi:MAG: hypothetical protein Q4C56_08460 [Peptococcaceae bacterium]|nr:hypothetical protein [Peptococcaceae bacterium]